MTYQEGQHVTIRLIVLSARDRGRLVLGSGPKATDHLILSEGELDAIEVRAALPSLPAPPAPKRKAKRG